VRVLMTKFAEVFWGTCRESSIFQFSRGLTTSFSYSHGRSKRGDGPIMGIAPKKLFVGQVCVCVYVVSVCQAGDDEGSRDVTHTDVRG
jgi:hypothetical protein